MPSQPRCVGHHVDTRGTRGTACTPGARGAGARAGRECDPEDKDRTLPAAATHLQTGQGRQEDSVEEGTVERRRGTKPGRPVKGCSWLWALRGGSGPEAGRGSDGALFGAVSVPLGSLPRLPTVVPPLLPGHCEPLL